MRFTKTELTELIKEELARKEKIKTLEDKKTKINEELKELTGEDFSTTLDKEETLDEWVSKEQDMLEEKWGKKVKIKEPGKYEGWTLEKLRAARAKLKKKEEHTEAETEKLRELNFAIRAKTGWGKVNK